MSDERTTYYTSSYHVSRVYRPNQWQDAVALQADSGDAQTNADQIYLTLANIANFNVGDHVLVNDTANHMGEVVQVQSVVENGNNSYLELTADMAGDYEVTLGGEVQLLSYFVRDGSGSGAARVVSSRELNYIINDVEARIERRTGHAWTARTVTDEVHQYPIRPRRWGDYMDGMPIKLNHRAIRTLASASGDEVNINEGSGYTNKISTWTEALNGNFWVDYPRGIFYLKKFWQWHARSAIKLTYRYGESTVPDDIRRAATLMTVIELLEMDDTLGGQTGGEGNYNPIGTKIENYKLEVERILKDREEVRFYNR